MSISKGVDNYNVTILYDRILQVKKKFMCVNNARVQKHCSVKKKSHLDCTCNVKTYVKKCVWVCVNVREREMSMSTKA